jgi:CRP-like cAMP-binding protein
VAGAPAETHRVIRWGSVCEHSEYPSFEGSTRKDHCGGLVARSVAVAVSVHRDNSTAWHFSSNRRAQSHKRINKQPFSGNVYPRSALCGAGECSRHTHCNYLTYGYRLPWFAVPRAIQLQCNGTIGFWRGLVLCLLLALRLRVLRRAELPALHSRSFGPATSFSRRPNLLMASKEGAQQEGNEPPVDYGTVMYIGSSRRDPMAEWRQIFQEREKRRQLTLVGAGKRAVQDGRGAATSAVRATAVVEPPAILYGSGWHGFSRPEPPPTLKRALVVESAGRPVSRSAITRVWAGMPSLKEALASETAPKPKIVASSKAAARAAVSILTGLKLPGDDAASRGSSASVNSGDSHESNSLVLAARLAMEAATMSSEAGGKFDSAPITAVLSAVRACRNDRAIPEERATLAKAKAEAMDAAIRALDAAELQRGIAKAVPASLWKGTLKSALAKTPRVLPHWAPPPLTPTAIQLTVGTTGSPLLEARLLDLSRQAQKRRQEQAGKAIPLSKAVPARSKASEPDAEDLFEELDGLPASVASQRGAALRRVIGFQLDHFRANNRPVPDTDVKEWCKLLTKPPVERTEAELDRLDRALGASVPSISHLPTMLRRRFFRYSAAVSCNAGDVLFEQGDEGHELFLVLQGQLEVQLTQEVTRDASDVAKISSQNLDHVLRVRRGRVLEKRRKALKRKLLTAMAAIRAMGFQPKGEAPQTPAKQRRDRNAGPRSSTTQAIERGRLLPRYVEDLKSAIGAAGRRGRRALRVHQVPAQSHLPGEIKAPQGSPVITSDDSSSSSVESAPESDHESVRNGSSGDEDDLADARGNPKAWLLNRKRRQRQQGDRREEFAQEDVLEVDEMFVNTVALVGPMTAFGEKGISSRDRTRKASVTAVEPSILLRVSGSALRALVRENRRREHARLFLALRRAPILASFPDSAVYYLAESARAEKPLPGQTFLAQGDEMRGLWIILSGDVTLSRRLLVPATLSNGIEDLERLRHVAKPSAPTAQDLEELRTLGVAGQPEDLEVRSVEMEGLGARQLLGGLINLREQLVGKRPSTPVAASGAATPPTDPPPSAVGVSEKHRVGDQTVVDVSVKELHVGDSIGFVDLMSGFAARCLPPPVTVGSGTSVEHGRQSENFHLVESLVRRRRDMDWSAVLSSFSALSPERNATPLELLYLPRAALVEVGTLFPGAVWRSITAEAESLPDDEVLRARIAQRFVWECYCLQVASSLRPTISSPRPVVTPRRPVQPMEGSSAARPGRVRLREPQTPQAALKRLRHQCFALRELLNNPSTHGAGISQGGLHHALAAHEDKQHQPRIRVFPTPQASLGGDSSGRMSVHPPADLRIPAASLVGAIRGLVSGKLRATEAAGVLTAKGTGSVAETAASEARHKISESLVSSLGVGDPWLASWREHLAKLRDAGINEDGTLLSEGETDTIVRALESAIPGRFARRDSIQLSTLVDAASTQAQEPQSHKELQARMQADALSTKLSQQSKVQGVPQGKPKSLLRSALGRALGGHGRLSLRMQQAQAAEEATSAQASVDAAVMAALSSVQATMSTAAGSLSARALSAATEQLFSDAVTKRVRDRQRAAAPDPHRCASIASVVSMDSPMVPGPAIPPHGVLRTLRADLLGAVPAEGPRKPQVGTAGPYPDMSFAIPHDLATVLRVNDQLLSK